MTDDEPKQPDLLPCPHCGSPGEVVEMSSAFSGTRYQHAAKAKCTECHHSVVGNTLEACFALSAKSWNKRAPHPDLSKAVILEVGAVEKVRIALDGSVRLLRHAGYKEAAAVCAESLALLPKRGEATP